MAGKYESALATIGRGYDMFMALPSPTLPDMTPRKGRPTTTNGNGNGHTTASAKTGGRRAQTQQTVGQTYTTIRKRGRKPTTTTAAPKTTAPRGPRGDVPTVPDRIAILMENKGEFRVADIIKPLENKGWLPESKNLNNYLSFVLSSNKDRFENISRGLYRVIGARTSTQGKGRRVASKGGTSSPAAGGPPVQNVEAELEELGIGTTSVGPNPFNSEVSNG